MKKVKRRFETLSFYDHTAISAHLEKMASKGWMISKITNIFWIYKPIEPKKIHFAVSYYPKASEFDPEPTEQQKMFHEFCAHTGWKLACTAAQMQIFYNERENPVPIETEPELEIQTIHASVKKGFIPVYLVLLIIGLFNTVLFISNLISDPVDLLSNTTDLFRGTVYFLLVLLCVTDLSCYFVWRKRAIRAAAHGEFLKTISTSKFQKVIIILVFSCAVYWLSDIALSGEPLQIATAVATIIYIVLLFYLVNKTKEVLKEKKVSRGVNRTLTVATSFVLSFAMMGGIIWAGVYAVSHGLFDKELSRYDELPLGVEDLLDISTDDYTSEQRGSSSILMGQYVVRQHNRHESAPWIEYTVVNVNLPFLYGTCREWVLKKVNYYSSAFEFSWMEDNPTPWGAKEAYRLYDEGYGYNSCYVLCYDRTILEIMLSWDLTDEQKAIVGERLG